MRTGLTFLAILLIVALSTAFVAPIFVDWSQQRPRIEAWLSSTMGESVSVGGPIELRLLPTPYVRFGRIEIADRGAATARLSSLDTTLELGLAPLLRGEVRFTQASLDHPILTLRRDAAGGIAVPAFLARARSAAIAIDTLDIHDGVIEIARDAPAPMWTRGGVDLHVEATSLLGPFKGSGQVDAAGGGKGAFRFATAAFEGGKMRTKFVADATSDTPRFELDGALDFATEPKSLMTTGRVTGAAIFSGAITSAGLAGTPWRISGTLDADLVRASLDDATARIGDDDRSLSVTGSVKATFGDTPKLDFALVAKQLNLDSYFHPQGDATVSPAAAYDAIAALLMSAWGHGGPSVAVSGKLDADAVIVGGDAVANVSAAARIDGRAPIEGRLAADGPGQSHLEASGAIETGAAARFKGRFAARIGDARQLRDWVGAGAPEVADSLSSLANFFPYRAVAANGAIELSATGVASPDLTLTIERSTFTGSAAITRAVGGERARLFADLTTDSLDIDAVPNVATAHDLWRDADIVFRLAARGIRVARVGETEVEGGALALRLTRDRDEFRLERLSIADLGGASVEADGTANTSGRKFVARLDAARLRDLAALARRIAPGALSDALLARAGVLSPAKLAFTASAAANDSAGGIGFDSIAMQGSVGATHVLGKIDQDPNDKNLLSGTLTLDAPDSSPLLRQFGANVPSIANLGQAKASLSIKGGFGPGFDADASATIARADLSFRGRITRIGDGPDFLALRGVGAVKAADAAPALAALGVASADSGLGGAVDLSAEVLWRADQLLLSKLHGAAAGARVAGDLAWRPERPVETAAAAVSADSVAVDAAAAPPPPPQLRGSLSLDRLPLGGLAQFALGAQQPVRAGALWSDRKFPPGLVNAPTADVGLTVDSLALTDAASLRSASLRLRLGPGLVAIDDLTGLIGDEALHGHALLQRHGAMAAIAGQVSLPSLAIERPAFAGKVAGTIDFAGSGSSAAALVASLAGSGQIQLIGARVPHLDPAALGHLLERAQDPEFSISQGTADKILGDDFERRPMTLDDGAAPAALGSGVIRVGPLASHGLQYDARVEGALDLQSFALSLQATITQRQSPKFWSDAPPSVTVAIHGPLDAPVRQIDSGPLVGGLISQAVARETDRIAALEADIRERAFFNRRLKSGEFLRRRDSEIRAFHLDQERQKSEEDRRRVEAERLQQDEARKAAQRAAPTPAPDAAPQPGQPPSPPSPPPPVPLPAPLSPDGLY